MTNSRQRVNSSRRFLRGCVPVATGQAAAGGPPVILGVIRILARISRLLLDVQLTESRVRPVAPAHPNSPAARAIPPNASTNQAKGRCTC